MNKVMPPLLKAVIVVAATVGYGFTFATRSMVLASLLLALILVASFAQTEK